jgi:O-methyltransferase involved in polyketide biosynthesis
MGAKYFLDQDGVLRLWKEIKENFVPQSRTINEKPLSADLTLEASDIPGVFAEAEIANKDSEGNLITETYATKTELEKVDNNISSIDLSDIDSAWAEK